MRRLNGAATLLAAGLLLVLTGCGEKETAYETNLLKNPSFEKVGSDGIPEDWELVVFRGLPNDSEVRYGIDENIAQDGKRSWRFAADEGTRRFYTLSQEVEVKDVTHVRLKGWMKTDQVMLMHDQFAQCNFLLTFYDDKHARFQELRFGDKRTRVKQGTLLWFEEDLVFRVPQGTRYIVFSCILGMNGDVWFDNVSLSVPRPIEWEQTRTPNVVYHWLPGSPPPEGAIANQQALFDMFAQRLGVTDSDVVAQYYYYPDTTAIRDILSIKGYQYVSWDDVEFHSINPNDNHEVIHFITDPYGMPPRAIAEGTVYWLWGEWDGRPILPMAAYLQANDMLASISDIVNYSSFAVLDSRIALPTAAAFVEYLVTRFGTAKLLRLYEVVSGVNSYGPFSQGIENVYGVPALQLEREFRAALAKVDYTVIEDMGLPVPETR